MPAPSKPLVDDIEHLARELRERIPDQSFHDLYDIADGVAALYASRDFYLAANENAKVIAERNIRRVKAYERRLDTVPCKQCPTGRQISHDSKGDHNV